ncbi:MAG: undecaprenyl-diphosphate phosphatase [candidate division Zixibacteria bacterium]|nr:undecaprenyl-diphosphate phosphatase [candidate division Zixibacteria bacterium]
MSFWEAALLGLIQGLTEFLPVSSSGHLVLGQALLGVKQPGVAFELLTHLGTLLAVLIYFRARILQLIKSVFDSNLTEERRIVVMLVVATLPLVLIGTLFESYLEQFFSNPWVAANMLLATGAVLLTTRLFKDGKREVRTPGAIAMGLAQCLALLPGLSRSGSTIAFGMLAGVSAERAAEFSFLMAIPAILGAVVYKARELSHLDTGLLLPYLVGTAVAFGSGLFAVYAVLAVIRKGKFEYFAYYCFAAGVVGLYLFS